MSDTIIEIENLSKLFGFNTGGALKLIKDGLDKTEILKKTGITVGASDVSFKVKKGETFVLIGLSGSGKSTVVRCLNLLYKPTTGKILFNSENILEYNKKQLRDYRRNKVAMVFQHFGLISNRNVLGNVAFGLEVKGTSRDIRDKRAKEMIDMVGLSGWENHPVTDLSGGMRQRVGIARALANDPEVLLMDEPYSALDPIVRRDMQFELLNIQKKVKKTIIFITHDINEAFKLGDTVAIMKDGKIVQIGTPNDILANPASRYVEEFVRDIDKTKVLSVKNVMTTPTAFIRASEGPNAALKEMKATGVSSVFVVGQSMELLGILTIDGALSVKNGTATLEEAMLKNILTTQEDVSLSQLLPDAAVTKFPIAVTNGNNILKGIVTKAGVISSLA
ncbi:MAG: glycine betaine/L-proline ABC transporter ATP-binding protein [Bacillota bacterium]|nr:glycine betaine/L-proline ABC transporter ATP-binding protein [Bacillota bacterium]